MYFVHQIYLNPFFQLIFILFAFFTLTETCLNKLQNYTFILYILKRIPLFFFCSHIFNFQAELEIRYKYFQSRPFVQKPVRSGFVLNNRCKIHKYQLSFIGEVYTLGNMYPLPLFLSKQAKERENLFCTLSLLQKACVLTSGLWAGGLI